MKHWVLILLFFAILNLFCYPQETNDTLRMKGGIIKEIYGGISYSPIYGEGNFYLYNLLGKITMPNFIFRVGTGFEFPQKNKIGYFDFNIGGEGLVYSGKKIKLNSGLYFHLGYEEYNGNSIFVYYRNITLGISPFIGIKVPLSEKFFFLGETSFSFSYMNQKYPSRCKTFDCDFFYTEKKFIVDAYKLINVSIGYKL